MYKKTHHKATNVTENYRMQHRTRAAQYVRKPNTPEPDPMEELRRHKAHTPPSETSSQTPRGSPVPRSIRHQRQRNPLRSATLDQMQDPGTRYPVDLKSTEPTP
jgi:hypothetical protein